MADGRHFEKMLNRHLSNRLIDLDEIWDSGADWPHTGGRSLKFPKTKMAAAAILKNHKNRDNTTTDWHNYAKWVS